MDLPSQGSLLLVKARGCTLDYTAWDAALAVRRAFLAASISECATHKETREESIPPSCDEISVATPIP